ncbi:YkgJ family cysteine cluster protein [Candidatus Woesearchaeota archaeon]|nr:YkgJ family cysteine cluster protein [Candidatus Woesearchaeota archaeon]
MIKCTDCGKCCHYITVPLDTPEDNEDYDSFVWYLLHENIQIYIDAEDEDWYMEVMTPCKKLVGKMCSIYEHRPNICRDYDEEGCEVNGEGSPYKLLFKNAEDFIAYLRMKGITYAPNKAPQTPE